MAAYRDSSTVSMAVGCCGWCKRAPSAIEQGVQRSPYQSKRMLVVWEWRCGFSEHSYVMAAVVLTTRFRCIPSVLTPARQLRSRQAPPWIRLWHSADMFLEGHPPPHPALCRDRVTTIQTASNIRQ